jgi:hypothetical protein
VVIGLLAAGMLAGLWWWRWARGAAPGSDARLLLAVARSVADGAGPRLPDGDLMVFRGPVWPSLAGTVLRVAGDGPGLALIRAGGAAALGVALVALGRRWYTWAAGLLAVVLAATTAPPVLGVLADWYTDPLGVALVFAALVVLDRALVTGSGRQAVAAGALLAAAVLTKESTGFAAVGPVAAALALADRDGWGFLRPLATAAATATALVGPWLTLHVVVEDRFFLTLVEGAGAWLLLGGWWALTATIAAAAFRLRSRPPDRWRRPRRRTAALLAAATVAGWAAVAFAGLAGGVPQEAQDVQFGPLEIVRRFLLPALGPWPLVALGLAALARGVARRERGALGHAAALGSFVPVLVVWPLSGSVFIARNGLVAVLLVHLAAGAGVVRAVSWSVRARSSPVAGSLARALPVAAVVVVVLAVAGPAARRTWEKVPPRPPDRLADLDAAAAWLRPRLRPGEGLVGSYLAWARLAWHLGPGHPVHLLPSAQVRLDAATGQLRSVPVVPVVGTPRRVEVEAGTDDWIGVLRHPNKGFLSALSRARLVEELRAAGARFLVLGQGSTRDGPELAVTLESTAGVRRAATFGSVIVLAVDPDRLADAPLPPAASRRATIEWLARRGDGCTRRRGEGLGWPPRPAELGRCGPLLLQADRPHPTLRSRS